uniref:Uncharacterized protein n=1 Tax=Tetranychus urticae TaxID=32264 RepID=T1K622_TETUR
MAKIGGTQWMCFKERSTLVK